MKDRNLNLEDTILELSRLCKQKKLNVIRAIVNKIVKTGNIDNRAIDIIKEEKRKMDK